MTSILLIAIYYQIIIPYRNRFYKMFNQIINQIVTNYNINVIVTHYH